MLKLGLTAALLFASATAAFAQGGPPPRGAPPPARFDVGPPPAVPAWRKGHHPYARNHHDVCHRKAWRLHRYDSYARADGRLSRDERREIASLRYDLDRTCGRYRWRG